MVIRVLLADDSSAVRNALRQLVARDAGLQLVGEAEDGDVAAQLALKLRPEVVLLDISMPRVNGFEAARRIAGSGEAGIHVIALSLHADWQVVVEALRAGAAGYLLKTGVSRELGRAVRCVAGGNMYLSDPVIEAIRHDSDATRSWARPDLLQRLTEPERRALDRLSRVFSRSGGTCARLGVEAVEPHRQGIMEKLGLPTFAELMRFALHRQVTATAASE